MLWHFTSTNHQNLSSGSYLCPWGISPSLIIMLPRDGQCSSRPTWWLIDCCLRNALLWKTLLRWFWHRRLAVCLLPSGMSHMVSSILAILAPSRGIFYCYDIPRYVVTLAILVSSYKDRGITSIPLSKYPSGDWQLLSRSRRYLTTLVRAVTRPIWGELVGQVDIGAKWLVTACHWTDKPLSPTRRLARRLNNGSDSVRFHLHFIRRMCQVFVCAWR